MAAGVHLNANTPYEAIARWDAEVGGEFHVELASDAGFALFAENLAIQKLYALRRKQVTLTAACNYSVPLLNNKPPSTTSLGIFNEVFGLALLLEASTATDAEGRDLRETILPHLWEEVLTSQGFVGSGKYAYLICRDPDLPIPPALLEESEVRFPGRTAFTSLVREAGERLGSIQDFAHSDAERALVSFLYETARNSYEHARADLEDRALTGSRAIIFRKIRISGREKPQERRDLPRPVRDYLEKSGDCYPAIRLFVSITVVDVGPGLHRTLPPKADESAWDRLIRAFQRGESRKPTGAEMNRGEGLPIVLEALDSCLRTKAFLFVQSAEFRGFKDFSASKGKGELDLQKWPLAVSAKEGGPPEPASGTAIALLWPLHQRSADQKSLFD